MCTSVPTTSPYCKQRDTRRPLWVGIIWAWMDIPAGGSRISAAFVSHCSAAWPPLSRLDPAAAGTNPRLFWTTRARPVRSAHQPHSRHHTSDKGSGCWGPGAPPLCAEQTELCAHEHKRINTTPFEAAESFLMWVYRGSRGDTSRPWTYVRWWFRPPPTFTFTTPTPPLWEWVQTEASTLLQGLRFLFESPHLVFVF